MPYFHDYIKLCCNVTNLYHNVSQETMLYSIISRTISGQISIVTYKCNVMSNTLRETFGVKHALQSFRNNNTPRYMHMVPTFLFIFLLYWSISHISFRYSLALSLSYNCPSVIETIMEYMGNVAHASKKLANKSKQNKARQNRVHTWWHILHE